MFALQWEPVLWGLVSSEDFCAASPCCLLSLSVTDGSWLMAAVLLDSHPTGWQLVPTAVLSFTELAWFYCLLPCPSFLLSTNLVPLTWEKAHAAAVFPDPLPAHVTASHQRHLQNAFCGSPWAAAALRWHIPTCSASLGDEPACPYLCCSCLLAHRRAD